MKDLLEYLVELWQAAGFPGIAGFIALLIGVAEVKWKLIRTFWKERKQRKQLQDLFPFYTSQEVQNATQYYVETTCQNIAPSKDEEPGQTHAFATKEKIIPFFLNKAFKPQKEDRQFYIVLADSGMGKTTFLINLYLRYIDQFIKPSYQITLFPLGYPKIDDKITSISDEDKKKTILLLDAFDEDMQAVQNYKTRLQTIIDLVSEFREVVITCRTQFFPSEEEEPKETGVLRFGPKGGTHVFRKLYLSPFDEQDIQTYLKKRFSWFQQAKRDKAQQIVLSCPNLMVRPMLLSYIEDLLKSEHTYTATYTVYAELINRWVEREARKFPPERREHYMEELYQFSREIAVDLYRRRVERQGSLMMSSEEIQPFAEKHGITLNEMEMKSKSLLNRNAHGEYKFSHKSVLEYFLAEEAFFNEDFRQKLDFESMDQAEVFFDEIICEKLTVPFFSRNDVTGEYHVNDGIPRVLTKLSKDILAKITTLKLQEWKSSDDVLLLKGLKNLERLCIETRLTPQQKNEFYGILPKACTLAIWLRSEPKTVSQDDAPREFGMKPFVVTLEGKTYDTWRPQQYLEHDFEDQGEVVVDHATDLMWQKSGSGTYITYKDAQKYIKELNRQKFAGYNDWRLPTIPELMSLLEPEERSNGLYVNPIFDSNQIWCWSADRLPGSGSSGAAWSVLFDGGNVDWYDLDDKYSVRVVRS